MKEIVCETVKYSVIVRIIDGKKVRNNWSHFKKRTYLIKDEK